MKEAIKYTLIGSNHILKVFKEFPEEGYRKPIMAGFKKAAIPVKKAIVSAIPARIKSIKVAVKSKPSRKGLIYNIGFYSKAGVYVNSRGKKWDPFQLAYWFNYGTYANRSPGHNFVKARRRETADRKGGITPDLFIEKGWENSSSAARNELEKEWAKQISKLCEKYFATQ